MGVIGRISVDRVNVVLIRLVFNFGWNRHLCVDCTGLGNMVSEVVYVSRR